MDFEESWISLKIVYIIFIFKAFEVNTSFQNIRMSIGSNECKVSSSTSASRLVIVVDATMFAAAWKYNSAILLPASLMGFPWRVEKNNSRQKYIDF